MIPLGHLENTILRWHNAVFANLKPDLNFLSESATHDRSRSSALELAKFGILSGSLGSKPIIQPTFGSFGSPSIVSPPASQKPVVRFGSFSGPISLDSGALIKPQFVGGILCVNSNQISQKIY